MEILITTLLISIFIQALFFILAASFKTDKVTDLSYGLGFIFLVIFLLLSNTSAGVVQSTVAILVIFWGLRLIVYLFQRILKIGKDHRFNGVRENFWKFFQFWLFQAIAVWIISIPSALIISKQTLLSYGILYYFGIFIWITGITIETLSDQQKFNFKNDPKNKDKWIGIGLWKYSRHPNYFGEMLCWWGIYFISLPYLKGFEHVAIFGPLFITFLLLFVSGIPPLEKKYNEKYKDDSSYQTYKKQTSLIIPLPKRSNKM